MPPTRDGIGGFTLRDGIYTPRTSLRDGLGANTLRDGIQVGAAAPPAPGNFGSDTFSAENGTPVDDTIWTVSNDGLHPTEQRDGYLIAPILEHATDFVTTWFGSAVGKIHAQKIQAVDGQIVIVANDIGIARIEQDVAGYPFDGDNDVIDYDNDPVENVDVPAPSPFCFCGMQIMPVDAGDATDLLEPEYQNATVGHRGITPANRTIEVKNTTARFGSPTSSTVDAGNNYVRDNSPDDARVDLMFIIEESGGFMVLEGRYWRPVGADEDAWIRLEDDPPDGPGADPEFQFPLFPGDTIWAGLMTYSFQTQSVPFVGRIGGFEIRVGTHVPLA